MRRWAAKVDKSQPGIVKALRAVGATVKSFAPTRGEPDLLVGYRGTNFLLECKTPGREKAENRHGTLAAQALWRDLWRGLRPVVVSTPEQALEAIGVDAGGLGGDYADVRRQATREA